MEILALDGTVVMDLEPDDALAPTDGAGTGAEQPVAS